jgi:hypothetical protein
MVRLRLHWLRIYRIYDTCFLDNGQFNQALIGLGQVITRANASCYNAFSRVDMRVEVKIPGGVKTIVIDERGTKSNLP